MSHAITYKFDKNSDWKRTDNYVTNGHFLMSVQFLADQKRKLPWMKKILSMQNGSYFYGEWSREFDEKHLKQIIPDPKHPAYRKIESFKPVDSEITENMLVKSVAIKIKTSLDDERDSTRWVDPAYATFLSLPLIDQWLNKGPLDPIVGMRGQDVVAVIMPMRGPK